MTKSLFATLLAAGVFALNASSHAGSGPPAALTPRQQEILDAAKDSPIPHFNGARGVGIYPNTPFLYSLAATGIRPMKFAAEGLPAGLKLDPESGIITGTLASVGEHNVTVRAANAAGEAQSNLRIVAGEKIALTPPMGWNSYDAFGDCVVESEVLANATYLKEHLQPAGWDTVVVDFRWYDSLADGIRVQNPQGVSIDEFGRCIPPTNRFPSAVNDQGFKPLAEKIHAMGLKFGIHIMRGIPRKAVAADLPIHGTSFKASQATRPVGDTGRECRWNRDMYGVDAATDAGKAWYADIAKQYAQWGVDYIKCDDMATLERGTNMYPQLEIDALSSGLRNSGRSIILSLSPGPALVDKAAHLQEHANLWRISNDFWDRWSSLNRNFGLFTNWLAISGPGHWADGDMIPFGHICVRNCDVKPDRWTRFTPDEQLTLMSLWALAPSPLMLGNNLPDNDAWTSAILANAEVTAVNQDALGRAARCIPVSEGMDVETWVKELSDGSKAVGFFNRSNEPVRIDAPWKRVGFDAPQVRDLWLHKDLGRSEKLAAEIPPHGCVLLRVK
jgi:hypothetical protein